MRKLSPARLADNTSIDLTPMLDVVFILLIFFVVTATFLSETAVGASSAPVPDTTEVVPPTVKNMLFQIGPNDEITLNGQPRPIVPSQIRANMERLKAENAQASVIIQPHFDSNVATLVRIIDSAQLVGVAGISIIEP